MDNNLPLNKPDDNQTKDDLNINPPVPPASPSIEPEKPVIPEMPEVPETPPPPPPKPTEDINISEPMSKPKEPKPEEKPIEIGSLGNPSSFASYTQEKPSGSLPEKNNKKGKKIKNLVSVLGILLIIITLPLTILLVKQRQEIRKEAAGTEKSSSISFCGITITPGDHFEKNGTYTFKYSITGNGHSVRVHEYGCYCSNGSLETCGTSSGKCSTNEYTKNTPIDGVITVHQPAGDCGTFQADVFVLSVDGRSECHNN